MGPPTLMPSYLTNIWAAFCSGKMIEADHGRAAHGFKDVVVDHAVVFRDSGQGQASAALRRPSSIVPSQQGLPCESAPVCSRGVSGEDDISCSLHPKRAERGAELARLTFVRCARNRKIAPKACECGYAEMKAFACPPLADLRVGGGADIAQSDSD